MNSLTGRFCHALRIAVTIAALLVAASCGQKGPLYLPDPAPQSVPAGADQKPDTNGGTSMDNEASGDSSSDPAQRKNASTVPPGL